MEPTQQGPELLRKSAFRVRTKIGSAQGARPSGQGLESTDNSLSQSQLKPLTKLEDRKKLPGLTRLTNPAKVTAELGLESRDGTLAKEKNTLDEMEEQQEDVGKQNPAESPEEQNLGFTVKSFKTGKPQGGIKQTLLKMNKIYAYEDLEIFSTRFSPDDTSVAVGLSDGRIEIKQLAGTKKTDSFQTSPEELPVSHIRWKSSKRIIASNVEGYLIEYDTQECTKIASVRENDNQILGLDYSAELLKICTTGKDSCVRIYDDSTKRLVRTYEKGSWYSPGHSNRVFAAKFKPKDNNILLTGGWDSAVFIWDIRQPKNVDAFVGPNISGDTIDVKDDVMLIGSHRARDSLEMWDFGTRKKMCNIEIEPGKTVDNGYVYACQYSKTGDDQIIAGMAVRNEIRVFDRNLTYSPSWAISGFDRAIYTLDWGNKGKRVAFGGGAGKVFIFKLVSPTDKEA